MTYKLRYKLAGNPDPYEAADVNPNSVAAIDGVFTFRTTDGDYVGYAAGIWEQFWLEKTSDDPVDLAVALKVA